MAFKCFNNLEFCWHETRLLLAALIYSWEDVGHQGYSVCSLFLLGKTGLFGKELPLTWLLTVSTLCNPEKKDSGKKNDCWTLPRQGRTVFWIFLLQKMVCQIFKVGYPQHYREALSVCSVSQLSLSSPASFRSRLLALPTCSGNISFLLRSLMRLKTR